VTIDAEFAIAAVSGAAQALASVGFVVEEFSHLIDLTLAGSHVHIQITVNSRYGDFPPRSRTASVLGIPIPVGAQTEVVRGKLRAATDPSLRQSKRLKDELDILRLAEAHAEVFDMVPPGLIPALKAIRPV
jgi:hypothetical protein